MREDFSVEELARPDLADLVPYEPHRWEPGLIKLDANENPYDFPAEVLAGLFAGVDGQTFNRYPDPAAGELRADLARYVGVRPEGVLVGNGSDEMILNLFLAFATGGSVAIATPTFGMYAVHARIAGAVPVAVPRRAGDFAADMATHLRRAREDGVRVTVLCSPNNPTGNATPPEEVAELAAAARGLVVVDEAYGEFGGRSCLPLLAEHPNLVVLKSFSKSFGLAGLRVGYLVARPEVVAQVLKVKQPFNVNTFSQMAARAVLRHLPLFYERIDAIRREREVLRAAMAEIPGVTVHPSEANFLLFRTPLPAGEVHRALMRRGVLVRLLDGPDLPGYLRVTVGRPEENRAFLAALRDVMVARGGPAPEGPGG
ncbi:MAG: histidinol-phosphate transaminase [Firmicutes bacterium]|nr:histidinol-phosphate transaminase [Bacillota bacterium]